MKEQLRDAKGAHAHYMACHTTHTVTGGPPLNLFRITISDNENDDATAADATAADDEDDDCDNDYTHSIEETLNTYCAPGSGPILACHLDQKNFQHQCKELQQTEKTRK